MKIRIKARHFITGTLVRQMYVVEALFNGRWYPLANDHKGERFPTKEAALNSVAPWDGPVKKVVDLGNDQYEIIECVPLGTAKWA